MIRWFGHNRFLVGLVLVVIAAFVLPGPGAPGGILHPEITSRVAVVVIFFVQGLVLALDALRAGLMRWRLHVLVQSFTYLVIPALGIALDAVFGRWLPAELRLGFLYLSMLPTTVSSAVMFTALAKGNTAGAIVNTTMSNVFGVVVTPLWVSVMLHVRGGAITPWSLMGEISLLVLAPLVAGQIVRPFARHWIAAHHHRTGSISGGLVLFIVYTAFAGSVASGMWVRYGWAPAALAAIGAALFFALVLALTIVAVRVMRLSPADRTAALFCAPQKTLAAGVPMAKLIFASNPALGLILLPVMFYHPLQLLVSGVLVNWIRREGQERS